MRATRILSLFALSSGSGAFAQSPPVFDVPDNHYAFDAVRDLRSKGIVVGFYEGFIDRAKPVVRSDFATILDAATGILHVLATKLKQPRSGQDESNESFFQANPQARFIDPGRAGALKTSFAFVPQDVEHLIQFLSPELQARGRDLKGLRRQLCRDIDTIIILAPRDPAPRQFSDVPKVHWAASAVLNLRAEGVVRGYPNETFAGEQ